MPMSKPPTMSRVVFSAFGALEVKGRESKASVRAPIAWFFRFDGEKICWARAYSDRAAALQEAGVPESSLG